MKQITTIALAASLAIPIAFGAPASAEEDRLNVIFTTHAANANTFWLTVKKGMDEACELYDAECQMIFAPASADVAGQISNIQAAIAQNPDMIVTSIVNDRAFDEVIQEATDRGIAVIAANVDDRDGAKGNARLAYVGQSFVAAGQSLGRRVAADFPNDGPIRVLVGVNSPSGNWSRSRADGVILALEEWKAENPDRDISWDEIDAGLDYATTGDRFGNYLTTEPGLNAYFDTGFWDVGAVNVLEERGIEPGEIILAGFDLVPDVITQMKAGYIQYHVDQQPYLQGYAPIVQAYLIRNFGLAAFDVDAGSAIVAADQAERIEELSIAGYR